MCIRKRNGTDGRNILGRASSSVFCVRCLFPNPIHHNYERVEPIDTDSVVACGVIDATSMRGSSFCRSSIASQMDVSKFALDRSAYLNTAAAGALYDTTKSQTNPYSAYLDPTSVLTKAYFDSKIYGASLLGGGGGVGATASGLYQYSAAAMAASQAAANGTGSTGSGGGGSGGGVGGTAGEYRRPLTVIF
uniref:Uncharacterized protein n=1 Tax=Anopheles minimus TaxID=112268 RepID=A0A182WG05_9DIPT